MNDSTKGNDRRHFLAHAAGLIAGLALLSSASAVTIFRYVFGKTKANPQFESERLRLLAQDAELAKLEVERQSQDQILIGRLSDLDAAKGKYFTDYEMQQALAFLDKDNLPLLLSAKCTHLGCTVGADVDDGRILCPCHISYFDINTGQPSAGSPAKKPLPHLSWVLKDEQGNVVASKDANGSVKGKPDLANSGKLSVFLVKETQPS